MVLRCWVEHNLENTLLPLFEKENFMCAEMKIAVLQSNYLPWYGYFKIISEVNLFIFFDSTQYTKNDWRNRNRILVNNSPFWLTIPVGDNINRKIKEVQLPSGTWRNKHIKSMTYAYSKAPYFHLIDKYILPIINDTSIHTLSELNQNLVMSVSRDIFNLKTEFHSFTGDMIYDSPSKRIAQIVESFGGNTYISGPSASSYLDYKDFIDRNILIKYINYGDLGSKNSVKVRQNAMLSIVHGIAWHGQNALRVIGELE
jgi:hypothetical protein